MSQNLQECIDKHGSYVKLNVGGTLFYTTIGTLTRGSTMLNAMFSGRMDVKTDGDGWVLIDRSGKHFGTILNFLRDGTVPLPDTRRELLELFQEARFFCIEEFKDVIEHELAKMPVEDEPKHKSTIVIVKCPKMEKALLSSSKKPVVKLTMNRYNNVFSYTSNSHDNLLRNIECLEKYALMFADTVLFMKDVRDKSEQNEICEWSYYYRAYKLKSIDCIAIHYSSEKRLIKVEFPESRIHEEMLFLISVATRGVSDAELMEIAMRKHNGANPANGPPSGEREEPESDQGSGLPPGAAGSSPAVVAASLASLASIGGPGSGGGGGSGPGAPQGLPPGGAGSGLARNSISRLGRR